MNMRWGGGTSAQTPGYAGAPQVLKSISVVLFDKGKMIPDNLTNSIQIPRHVFFDLVTLLLGITL